MKPEREHLDENEKIDFEISSKMSKSRPWTAIFIHDSKEKIEEKMMKAWCPQGMVEGNAPLEYVRYIIFREFKYFHVERPSKYGGNKTYGDYNEVEKDFLQGKLHPDDLKHSVAIYLNKIVKPYRDHFEKPSKKKLLSVYDDVEITR
jgi:tyrosyl-tRNA synthetase